MVQRLPFPFPEGQFPAALGAVVQRTVLTGQLPACEVIHTPDGSWAVGDAINDPNLPGASIATHMAHVVALNSSVARLATMAPGHIAQRGGPGEPWTIRLLDGWDNDESGTDALRPSKSSRASCGISGPAGRARGRLGL